MFVNHKNAKKSFDTLITTESPNWIIISGGEHSGKTSFLKEVCPDSQTLFCQSKLSLFYLEGFIPYISTQCQVCVKDFLAQFPIYWEEIRKKYEINYIHDISNIKCGDIIRTLIKIDIAGQTYVYADYLGNTISSNFNYVVLDDFYKCNTDCYEWLLHFAERYLKQHRYIIAVCNFNNQWESTKIYEIFHNVQELIDIQCFDTESDYFAVLKDNIYFDNIEELKKLAQELFLLYHKDAQLLFKTIKLYGTDKDTNDFDRKKRFLRIAHNLTLRSMSFDNKVDSLILELLALSFIPLSINDISNILELSEDIIQKIIFKHYNNDLLELKTQANGVCYRISDSLINNLIIQNTEMKTQEFILNRIWLMLKSRSLNMPIELQIELALKILASETEELLWNYFNDNMQIISLEKKMEYIDRLYSLNLHIKHRFSDYNTAKMAYEFGYFETALKMLLHMKCYEKLDYSFFMLLGGVQHLLLRPEAPKTFEKAANLPNITISQKLSAVNREIMSLNQADENSALKARQLYDSILKQYSNEKCDGLIELYRNTNNSYPADKALEYTIKGYKLATDLGNELEKYKCMHNICMIRLHQNQYSVMLNCKDMDVEPTFDLVDKFFKKNPQYYHKRAYPLLDLGTYEMFEYILTNESKRLKRAKYYYSKAQLFAKSFYARHIAEMSLLVVNTHLYCNQKQMVNSIRQKRKEIYKKYTTESIVDHRVNRKILLSLAVSAVLTQNIKEAQDYLALVKPYISGPEVARYTNLCRLCEGTLISEIAENSNFYYESPRFVPWLISLAH